MQNEPRVLGEIAWRPDFLKLPEIIEFLGSIQHAYAEGKMSTETVRTLADIAHKAGTLLVRSQQLTQEVDLLEALVRERGGEDMVDLAEVTQ